MSIQAVAAVLETDVGEVAAKMLLVCLANAHNSSTGFCAPSIARLKAESGMARSTVQKWLRWLEEEGFIESASRNDENGRCMSNLYRLTFEGTARIPGGTEGPNCGPSPISGMPELSGSPPPELSGTSKETLIKTGNKGAGAQARAHACGDKSEEALERECGVNAEANGSRFKGPDGREYLTFKTADNPKFITALLAEWSNSDGASKDYMRQSKAISVPVEIVELTRLRLAENEAENVGG